MQNPSREQHSANPYYLATLSKLQANQAIVAQHAIAALDGQVLVTGGSPLQHKHVRLLEQQRLRSPLEATLSLPGFQAHRLLQLRCESLLAEQPLLRALLEKTTHRHACHAILENLPLNHALSLFLAMLEQQGMLDHGMLCCLISLGLALRTNQPGILLEQIGLAALFHDIGELYLAPRQQQQGPALWRHRMAHPLIGYRQMLQLGQHKQLESVAQAILQHHERLDGSGYPRREKEKQLGVAGQLIAVADLASQLILHKNHPYHRLDIALRIVPGEFHRPSVSVMNQVLRQLGRENAEAMTGSPAMELLHGLLKHIGEITHLLLNLQEETLSPEGSAALQRCLSLFDIIQRSLFSTGMQTGHLEGQDDDVQREILLVCQEIAWRLRNLGRDLSLTQDKLGPDDAMLFQELSSHLLNSLPEQAQSGW